MTHHVLAPTPARPVPPGPGRRGLRPGTLALLAAGAWLVPLATHLVGVDALLPVLVLGGTAALLRVGHSALDRLLLALALLLGATCVAGLLFSMWPWGLAPVPVAGLALTVLVGLAGLLRRRPSLPRLTRTDLLALVTATVAAGYVLRPYLAGGLTRRIMMAMAGEDLARHVSIFDAIRAMGGYAFLDPARAGQLFFPGLSRYPQGSHLTLALLDGFVRGGTGLGSPVSAFDHFIGWHTAGFGFMVLAIAWSALRVAGPVAATGARALLVLAPVFALCLFGDLVRPYLLGYTPEIVGLGLLAMLAALLARPVPARPSQAVLLGALLIGVGYTYYLFLPAALLAAGAWLVLRWRWWWRARGWFAGTAVVAGALAVVPIVAGVVFGGQTQLLRASGCTPTSRDLLVAFALLVAAGLATGHGLRRPAWRSYLCPVAGAAVVAAGIGGYQTVHDGGTGYYYEKNLTALLVVLLVGLGAALRLVPPPRRYPLDRPGARPANGRPGTRLANRLRGALSGPALPVALLAAALAAALGAAVGLAPYRPAGTLVQRNPGRAWFAGAAAPARLSQLTARVLAEVPNQPGQLTLVFTGTGFPSYLVTLFVATLERNSGPALSRSLYGDGSEPGSPMLDNIPANQEHLLAMLGVPVNAVATTPEMVTFIQRVQADHPSAQIRLYDLSAPGG